MGRSNAVPRVRGVTVRTIRRVMGPDSAAERGLRRLRHRRDLATKGIVRTSILCAFRGDATKRFGVYGYGGCDLWALADGGPRLRDEIEATGAVYARGRASFTRSDLILQGYDGVDPALVTEVTERLGLVPAAFQPDLFERDFTIEGHEELGRYPKDVVVLSISSDLVRTLYRHREHGFLVDPGGFWLASDVRDALAEPETVKWFAGEFRKVGRITLEEWIPCFGRLVTLVRQTTGAHVVVFNSLTVDPGRRVLDYKLSHSPHRTRRREFAAALVELAKELDFSIVDVDRIVKGVGVEGLGDFVKLAAPHRRAVGEEFVRVLRDREII